MEYKNEELEKDYENNKNAMKKMEKKLQIIVNEYIAQNPDLEFRIKVEEGGRYNDNKNNPIIKFNVVNKKVFWTDILSFEYDVKLKNLSDINTSSGGVNKDIKPIEVVSAYQEIFNSIDCLVKGLKENTENVLELSSDILYYENKIRDIQFEYSKKRNEYFSELAETKLNEAGIKKITDRESATVILNELEEKGKVDLYNPQVDTLKDILKSPPAEDDMNFRVYVDTLKISSLTDNKIYYLDGERVAKSKLVEKIIGTYVMPDNFKVDNSRRFSISLSALEAAKKNKAGDNLLKELITNGTVKKIKI